MPWLRDVRIRGAIAVGAAILIISEVVAVVQPFLVQHTYALGAAGALLSPIDQYMAGELRYNAAQQVFDFNDSYTPPTTGMLGATGTQVTATASTDPSKGLTLTDPVHQISLTMVPQFGLASGAQDGNRIIYPLTNNTGWAVYTMHGIGTKEDLLLTSAPSNQLVFTYRISLGDSLAARIEPDGSIGIYGDTLLSGTVATSTSKDASLLQKARVNVPKTTLLFRIPAPKIKEAGTSTSGVKAAYHLDGDMLNINVSGLASATFPLSIDPSIYVTTAQQFMNGNNETNIDFDVADALIEKGPTTGARFDSWTTTTSLPTAAYGAGTVAAGGFVYAVGGQAFNGQIFSAAGTGTYTVPTGVTTVTIKAWGGGGGGGAGNGSTGTGGNGGGGGFAQADVTVTPGEALGVTVGSGGSGGGASSNGGDGGGYSAVQRSGTFLVQAGGGGGGGGGRSTASGGNGGPGGCSTSGTSCTGNAGTGGAGGGGSTSGGTAGAAGTGGTAGAAGAANAGGDAGGSSTNCNTSVTNQHGGAGGFGSGGKRGTAGSCEGGGGGGGGRFGGGGGGSASASGTRTGGGGGGGSDLVTGTNTTQTIGSGTTPGNSADGYRNGAGQGGGGTTAASGVGGSAGLVAIIVTGSSSVNTASINWEQFNPTDGTLESPNPGTGGCSGWCTSSTYNLPAARSNFSLVAYNGFLYALGGEDSSCTAGNGTGDGGICKTVYIAKLGANGEPQLWSPTSTDTTTWTYWYRDADLSSPRSMEGAVAYNNRLYLLGGKTSTSGTKSVVTTVEEADITGSGKLTSWTTTGMVTLRDPSNNANALARYGFGTQVYNGHIYVIGGASSIGGAPMNSAQYITLKPDGTMTGSWLTTSSITNFSGAAEGKLTEGGNFTAVWGAYIYLAGGCTAVNASGYCTAVAADTQLASINADGSLDQWNTIDPSLVSDTRMAHGVVAWQNALYEFGGCAAQDATTGACTGPLATDMCSANENNECTIDQDGDASTVDTSVASGTAPCSGANPYNCNLPPAGTGSGQGGQMLSDAAIMNGYLYVIGGCSVYQCTSTSGNTSYASIASNGTLTAPTNCTADGNTLVGAWCVDSTHTVSGGIAASGTAVFGGYIYLVGGLNGSANVGNIYHISVNADGSLSSSGWVSQTFSSTGLGSGTGGYTSDSYLYAYARANPSQAGSLPGNLYAFGGCTASSNDGCTAYSGNVYKCSITTTGSIDTTGTGHSPCTTTAQLQIGTIPGDTAAGLGIMAGTVYANYIYLIGGVSPNQVDLTTVRYARFDNNNNVVAVSGTAWVQSPVQTHIGRRRGAAFGYNGYLYVVGGYDAGSGVLDDIEFAKINVSDGSLADESGGSNLFNISSVTIGQRWGLSVPTSNSYAYVIGGCDDGDSPTCNSGGLQPVVQTFQIYNNDSGSPAAYGSSANLFATDRMGASAAVYNGYLYVAGGCIS
ncbi:MAG TPA: hypothetical protein VHC98_00930, partial [Candidatus Saccharimonadales bacterium]|nr:hypothetical protein [Candidatus Saccharimonadales bacterium]